MNRRQAYIFVISIIASMFVMACANLGAPDGGPYDETPPRIIKTTPEFGSVGSSSQRIVLEFDENVRLDNPSEKVIVSPPQMEQPDINVSGKKITIDLVDTIKPGLTYTIDFADAIQDNNEGNPMGDYAFTFSTGEAIDTMQVSGYVLDASNLEPIKGMLVGMYSLGDDSLGTDFPDSIFKTKPFERISRTDSRGHFIIKGIANGHYKVYALTDQDQTYSFTQKSEKIGFNNRIITPSCKPDIRPDTVWHDSLHYDSIVMKGYTHFFPDDIVLLAFNEKTTDRYLLKTERPTLKQFNLYFTNSSDELPVIEGLNFNSDDAFCVEGSLGKDTVNYWIRDSLIYNLDTLIMKVSYMATDTLGQLVLQTDTLSMTSKISKARMAKEAEEEYEEWVKEYKAQLKEEARRKKVDGEDDSDGSSDSKKEKKKKAKVKDEDIEIPPMPEKFLEIRQSTSNLDPDKNVDFVLPEPLDSMSLSCFHLIEMVDSDRVSRPFIIRPVEKKHRTYRLYAEWKPGHNYELKVDTGAFVSIYGQRTAGFRKEVRVKSLDSYSSLFVNLMASDSSAVVELLDGADKVVKTAKAPDGRAEFYFINPGTYYLRMYYDRNGNGKWDEGCYDDHLQAEEVYYYPDPLVLKAMWDIEQSWNPTATPVYRQKPGKITKQKPDKEKDRKSKNAERDRIKNKK